MHQGACGLVGATAGGAKEQEKVRGGEEGETVRGRGGEGKRGRGGEVKRRRAQGEGERGGERAKGGRGEAKRVERGREWSGAHTGTCDAIMIDAIRFRLASLNGSLMGMIDPVRITAFPSPSSMKERAEAVYAIVSVPWMMTKPS